MNIKARQNPFMFNILIKHLNVFDACYSVLIIWIPNILKTWLILEEIIHSY